MRAQIEILASLQEIDREIREKHGARDLVLAEIHRREQEIEAKKVEISLLSGDLAEWDKSRREKEKVLQEDGQKAMEKRMRMNRIKNIKELQALQREIDQIKQNNTQLEDELIKVLEELEARTSSLKEKVEELKKLEDAWGEKRRELEVQLEGNLIERYELIFARRGGMAVVAVSEGICQGCYMNIPPQLRNEIMKSERLNLCPSCHRILYYKPALPQDKQL
ncbi:MAG: hypothetical protein E6J89_05960 [Deltaproteobacteria bacterium]|nr:MAG: hypothetical protein E6J89_05960 [Deltaproteobacteria bacterium]